MDTAERVEAAGVGLTYDAFISYSHAADGLLAPRLQSALQRFAKAWWKRRAIRVFRDESSLSANPHLWSSITDALDASTWFVLVLSPEAAQSEWVNREIEYWLDHKEPDRILLVVTDGEFRWDGSGDAFPTALVGAFVDEPRWVDLRFARSDEQLDLNNARFRNAVADVASSVRGVAKDDLEGEEVRQHRRTTRTAWGAVALLVLLAVAALVNWQLAGQRATEAEAEALAASALAVIDLDPELSVWLGHRALTLSDDPTLRGALHEALQRHNAEFAVSWEDGRAPRNFLWGNISPDGRLLLVGGGGELELWDIAAQQRLWWVTLTEADGVGVSIHPGFFTADGSEILVATVALQWTAPDAGDGIGLTVIRADDGSIVSTTNPHPCLSDVWAPGVGAYDPSRPLIVEYRDAVDGACPPSTESSNHVGLLHPDSELQWIADGYAGWNPTLSGDDRLLAFGNGDVFVYDVGTGDLVTTYEDSEIATLNHDGSEILVGLANLTLRDTSDGSLVNRYQGQSSIVLFDDPNNRIVALDYDGSARVFDTETGAEKYELRGHTTRPLGLALTQDGTLLVTSGLDAVRVWDIRTGLAGELERPDLELSGWNAIADTFIGGDLLLHGLWSADNNETGYVVAGLAGGERLRRVGATTATLSPNGEVIAHQPILATGVATPTGRTGTHIGPLSLVDAATGTEIDRLRDSGYFAVEGEDPEPEAGCEIVDDVAGLALSDDGAVVAAITEDLDTFVWDGDGFEIWANDVEFAQDFRTNLAPVALSPDGRFVATLDAHSLIDVIVVDLETGTEVARFPNDDFVFDLQFDHTGSRLLGADTSANVLSIDVATWTLTTLQRGQGGSVRDVAPSPDGRTAASVGKDGFVRVWDLETGSLVEEFLIAGDLFLGLSSVEYLDADTLFVTSTVGEPLTFVLDRQRLLDLAASRLTRDMTSVECETYDLDPCPTLEEIRNG